MKRSFLFNGVCVLVSAVLFYLASPNRFNSHGYCVFAWIFAVPLLFVLEEKSLVQRLVYGTIFSLTAYALILSWVINISIFLFVFFSLMFAVQPVIFSAFLELRGLSKIRQAFFIAALWAVTEAVRGYLIGGYEWTIGHSQTFVPVLVQIADITGAYGISFVILLVNACLFFALTDRPRAFRYLMTAFVSVALIFVYGKAVIKEDTGKDRFAVCTIQPNLSSAEKGDPDLVETVVERQAAMAEQCVNDASPDLILWPETAVTDDVLRDEILNRKIVSLSRKIKTGMLIGSALLVDGKNYNSAVLLGPAGRLKGIYHKNHLLPFHEYFLFQSDFPLFRRIFRIKNYNFQRKKGMLVLPFGADSDTMNTPVRKRYFGVAICSEEGYPRLLRQQAALGAEFLVAMLNDAWFQSDAAVMMHAQDGLMQAASFKIPVVRSSNSGLSCLIDSYGRIRSRGPLDQPGVFHFDIELNPQETVYGRFGNIFALACGVFVAVAWMLRKDKHDAP